MILFCMLQEYVYSTIGNLNTYWIFEIQKNLKCDNDVVLLK